MKGFFSIIVLILLFYFNLSAQVFKDKIHKFHFNIPAGWDTIPETELIAFNKYYNNSPKDKAISGLYLVKTGNFFSPPNLLIKYSTVETGISDVKLNIEKIISGSKKSGTTATVLYVPSKNIEDLHDKYCLVDTFKYCVVNFNELKDGTETLVAVSTVFIGKHGFTMLSISCFKSEYEMYRSSIINIINSFSYESGQAFEK